MRRSMATYKGADALNYLCLLATQLLSEGTLDRIPQIVAGFDSVTRTLSPQAAQAVRNLRASRLMPASRAEMRRLCDMYRRAHAHSAQDPRQHAQRAEGAQRFEIDADLSVRPMWTGPPPEDVQRALVELTAPMGLRDAPRPALQDPRKPAQILSRDAAGYSGTVEALGFEPPPPPTYDLTRQGRAPGPVAWEVLVAHAQEFDRMDVDSGRQPRGGNAWYRRLHDAQGLATAQLMAPSASGLQPCKELELQGIKHLIGLPGAGKTTLLYLLAAHMDKLGKAAAFFFPSIEVATAFVETLACYGVDVGLVSGQSETTRRRHVLNFSSSLASTNNGFATTRTVAQHFATNCALAGFASDEEIDFPHERPPCLELRQAGSSKHLQCALSGTCGYHHSERGLTRQGIWAGHILSIDRKASRLFVDANARMFELVAKRCDLLVIDECDGAQAVLDEQGTPTLRITGDGSLWATLLAQIHQPAARGSSAIIAASPSVQEISLNFGKAAERLVRRVAQLPARVKKANERMLLTSQSLLADMYGAEDEAGEDNHSARLALELLWEETCKQVAFRREDGERIDSEHVASALVDNARAESGPGKESAQANVDDDGEVMLARTELVGHSARELRCTPLEITQFLARLRAAMVDWELNGEDEALKGLHEVLWSAPGLAPALGEENFLAYTSLLATVTMVVLRQPALNAQLRNLNATGYLSEGVFAHRPSLEMRSILPESLLGRLSGVRFTLNEGDSSELQIEQVAFSGTPRLLPACLQRLGADLGASVVAHQDARGPAVLLTSATSMLRQSPSFHIHHGPHYILRRPNAGDGWRASRYQFLPLTAPHDRTRPLRFSGAKFAERDAILCAMADALLAGGSLCLVQQAIDGNDVVDGVKRRAALVVNSYDQCQLLFEHIRANHRGWADRVRFLSRTASERFAVTASEVERIAHDPSWDLLIFPMSAIGRGVNIVFPTGARANQALIGTLYFLTRPHPRGESLQLIQGLVGRASQAFNAQQFTHLDAALASLAQSRQSAVATVKYLLRLPLMAQSLGKFAEPFVADQMIMVLQTIGRAMRGDRPAFVHFVDAAWAPESALGRADTARTSMLVMMQDVLRACLEDETPAIRQCYENLYLPFAQPLAAIENLKRHESA